MVMKETLTGLFCWAGEMNPARDKGVLAILEFAESCPDDDNVHWLSWGGYHLPANWYSYISKMIEVILIDNQVTDINFLEQPCPDDNPSVAN